MRKLLEGSLVVLACVLLAASAQAASINLGTGSGNAPNWLVDVYTDLTNKSTSGVAAIQTGNYISITSNDLSSGTWISGSSNTTFYGLWTATRTFTVPTGATGVSATFTNLIGDDRVTLLVNGHEIGWAAIGGTGSGVNYLPTIGVECCTYGTISGNLTPFLHASGVSNTLELIVNNTGIAGTPGLTAPPSNLNGTGDATDTYLAATVTYTDALPEPTTMALFGTMAIGFAGWRSRKRMA